MVNRKLISVAVMLAIFSCAGVVSWAFVNAQQNQQENQQEDTQPNLPPQNMPKLTLYEDISDAAVAYIKANHAEAAQFANGASWTGGRQENGLLGAETHIYQSGGWKVTIKFPVIANPTYSITAEYTAQYAPGEMGIMYHLNWEGTWQNGAIAETSYILAQ